MSFIRCENLEKIYDNEGVKTPAVQDVSFVIEKGEFVSIMGPSGSGKSTLMHMLGLLDRPTGGELYFEDKNAKTFDENTLAQLRNQKIGFVFQSFNLLPRTSVYENVELPLLYNIYGGIKEDIQQGMGLFKSIFKRVQNQSNKKKVEDALQSVGMEKRMKYMSNQLSGGEKQRVAIARALVNQPELIFADEPTGNLDSKSGLQVMRILQELNEKGHTVILVTHETYTAEHAKRILRMRDGKLESDETLQEWRVAKDEEKLK